MARDGKRPLRVAERVREEVARRLSRETGDDGLSSVIVSRVDVPDDLSIARVYVRTLSVAAPSDKEQRALIERLTRWGKRVRSEIGRSMHLRAAPLLRFDYDRGQDNAIRIQELLAEVAAERVKKDDS